jgi:ubiquitin-protein ligase
MTESKLNKELYTEINRLKLLTEPDAPVRYLLIKSPFPDIEDEDEDETNATVTSKEIIITGRIFPDSEIFKEGSYKIEMKLPSCFPIDPPEVRFLTPIYHPNVYKDGKR